MIYSTQMICRFFASKRVGHIALMSLCLFLTACSSRNADLYDYVDKVLERPGPPVPPIPKIKVYVPYHYVSANQRSPFELPHKLSATNSWRPDLNRPKEDLEGFSLDSLQLVGVFAKGNVMWALVAAPNGNVYQVTVGHYVGKNYGRVVKISKDSLNIMEMVSDGQGGWIQQPTTLELTSKDK